LIHPEDNANRARSTLTTDEFPVANRARQACPGLDPGSTSAAFIDTDSHRAIYISTSFATANNYRAQLNPEPQPGWPHGVAEELLPAVAANTESSLRVSIEPHFGQAMSV